MSVPKPGDLGIILAKAGAVGASYGNLKPQHGRTNEVGGSIALGAATIRGSAYRLDLDDEIGFDDVIGTNTNFPQTRRNGAELEADWKIAESLQARLRALDDSSGDGPVR